jgi:hypothetical protein
MRSIGAGELVGDRVGRIGVGLGIRHLEHRGHPAQHRGAAAAFQILLGLQPRLAEMDLAVDHAGQDGQPGAVDRLARIAAGADRDDLAAAHADIGPHRAAGRPDGSVLQDQIVGGHDDLLSLAARVRLRLGLRSMHGAKRHAYFPAHACHPILADRAVIRLSGEDVRGFLQGLVTNDVAGASPRLGSGLLTAQGKALFDFLLWADGDDLLIDCEADQADALARGSRSIVCAGRSTIAAAIPRWRPLVARPARRACPIRACRPRPSLDRPGR